MKTTERVAADLVSRLISQGKYDQAMTVVIVAAELKAAYEKMMLESDPALWHGENI